MAIARRSRIGWLLGSVAVTCVGGLVAVVAWRCIPPDSTGAGNHDKRFREQEVQFTSGGNTLAGVLVLPAGPGPHPAVVFLNGSDGADRTGRGRWPSVWRGKVSAERCQDPFSAELGSRIARCNRSPSSLAGILMGYFANGFIFASQPDFESSERRLVLPRGGGARANTRYCCQTVMRDRDNARRPASRWSRELPPEDCCGWAAVKAPVGHRWQSSAGFRRS
jgi:hypothetical protein